MNPEILTAVRASASRLTKLETWAYGLAGGTIGGGAGAVTTWLGMTGAKALGVDVPTLNVKALAVIFVSGAAANFFTYLAKSPLPPLPTGNTDTIIKPPELPK